MSHDVFISYAKPDLPVAEAICGRLEQDQMRCWIAPRDIPLGEVWASAIIKAVSASRVMVLVVSAHANESDQVMREVELAAERKLVLIPFLIQGAPLTGALRYFAQPLQWIDATPPYVTALDRLSGAVLDYLSRAACGADGTEGAVPGRIENSCTGQKGKDEPLGRKRVWTGKRFYTGLLFLLVGIIITVATVCWYRGPGARNGAPTQGAPSGAINSPEAEGKPGAGNGSYIEITPAVEDDKPDGKP